MADKPANQIPLIAVPETLDAPHRLIAAFIAADREDAETARRLGWPHQPRCSSELDKRGLRILSGLYDGLETRGHRLEHPDNSPSPVWFVIRGEIIEFNLIEYVRPTKVRLTPAELRKPLNIANGRTTKTIRKPMGQLVLLARSEFDYKKQRWSDNSGPLEGQLGSIILKFEEMAERAAAHRIELAEQHREIEEEMAREDEQQARQEKIARDWERLRAMAADWSEAQRVRRFIDAVAARLDPLPDPEGHGRSWLDWARAEVEERDPMGTGANTTLAKLVKGQGFRRWRDVTVAEDDEY